MIANLEQYRLPATRMERENYLEACLCAVPLLSLYRELFPDEYANSDAGFVAADSNCLSPREMEFARLVDERLFPLNLDCFEENARFPGIPFLSESLYLEDGWDGYREGIQMIGSLLGDFDRPELESLARYSLSRCRELDSPLKHLHLIVDWIERNTGNIWLDHCEDYDEPLDWTGDNIEFLRESYSEAMPTLDKITNCLDWIENGHQKEVFEEWTFYYPRSVLEA
jgi:hypothetical protein